MIWLLSVLIATSLLELVALGVLFRSIYVTNVKLEEQAIYKKSIKTSLEELDGSSETIKSQQTIIIDTLKRIVDLL